MQFSPDSPLSFHPVLRWKKWHEEVRLAGSVAPWELKVEAANFVLFFFLIFLWVMLQLKSDWILWNTKLKMAKGMKRPALVSLLKFFDSLKKHQLVGRSLVFVFIFIEKHPGCLGWGNFGSSGTSHPKPRVFWSSFRAWTTSRPFSPFFQSK